MKWLMQLGLMSVRWCFRGLIMIPKTETSMQVLKHFLEKSAELSLIVWQQAFLPKWLQKLWQKILKSRLILTVGFQTIQLKLFRQLGRGIPENMLQMCLTICLGVTELGLMSLETLIGKMLSGLMSQSGAKLNGRIQVLMVFKTNWLQRTDLWTLWPEW